MSYEEKGSGSYEFPAKDWKKNVKRLWEAGQSSDRATSVIKQNIYKVSQSIAPHIFFENLWQVRTYRLDIPILKTFTLEKAKKSKYHSNSKKFEKGTEIKIGWQGYYEEHKNLFAWIEEQTFGYDKPENYSREEVLDSLRWIVPFGKSTKKKKTPPKVDKISDKEKIIIKELKERFRKLYRLALDGQLKSTSQAGASTDPRINYADAKKILANRIDTTWYKSWSDFFSSPRDFKKTVKRNFKLTEKDGVFTWSGTLQYASTVPHNRLLGLVGAKPEKRNKWAEENLLKEKKIEEMFFPDYGIGFSPIKKDPISITVKKGDPNNHTFSQKSKSENVVWTFKVKLEPNLPSIPFKNFKDLETKNDYEYRVIATYYQLGNLGTTTPILVKPPIPKSGKMPQDKWTYGKEVGDGRASVWMEVLVKDRYVKIDFDGNSASSYIFSTPVTAELKKIIEETKFSNKNGGQITWMGEDREGGTFFQKGYYARKR